MAEAPATFAWRRGALVETELAPHDALLAADSWYLSPEGRARALDTHRERFLAAVREQSAALPSAVGERMPEDASLFWGASVSRLRSFGGAALFPRLELAATEAGPELRLRARVALRLRSTTVLTTHQGGDPRTVPRTKGPDLEALLALRATAQEDGADELVLLQDGLVVDGSTSALLWWRGETLVAPAGDLARVASVTARSIRLIATATGTRVVEERARPADLEGAEVWSVSALHGITVVDRWIGGPAVSARASRAATWRRRLEALSRPL